MNVRQATHPYQGNSGFLERNCLTVESRPPCAEMLKPISGFFLMNWLAVTNTRQVTRVCLMHFLMFYGFWAILDQWKGC